VSGRGQVPRVREHAHGEVREESDGQRRGDEACGDSQPSPPARREGTAQPDDEQQRGEPEEQKVHPWEVASKRPSFEHERVAQKRNRAKKES
jgi:hypothetical protein